MPPEALDRLDPDALRRAADVAARFDPLALRDPLAHWRLDEAGTLARVVDALAEFLSPRDIDALAVAVAADPAAATRGQNLACRWRERGSRRDVQCGGADGLMLSGRLSDGRLRIDRLVLGGGLARYRSEFVADGGGYRSTGATVRGAGGAALRRLEPIDGGLLALWVDEFAPIDAAITRLEALSGVDGANLFDDGPVQRERLLAPLLAHFGLPAPEPAIALPAIDPVPAPTAGATADAALQPFYRYCAACHDAADAFPPGFLNGTADRVRERLASCAPRILRRLQMWQLPSDARSKTPMPPPSSAQATGFARSEALAAMRGYLERSLRAAGLDPDDMAAMAYADLPNCATY